MTEMDWREGEQVNRVFRASAIINYYSKKVLDCNMDTGEIVYATVEEIIGKTGKCSWVRGPNLQMRNDDGTRCTASVRFWEGSTSRATECLIGRVCCL